MTTPSIVPTKWTGTDLDYLRAKVERDGSLREQYTTVTVPASTVITTIVGLVPFQKGYRLGIAATQLNVADLDTSTNVTFDVGYVYKTGSAQTDGPNVFGSALTTAQAGGNVSLSPTAAGIGWVAQDDGWIAVTMSGGSTTTSGAFTAQIVGCYDGATSAEIN